MSTSQKKAKRSLKMHSGLKRPWHEDSTLVFKSKEDKVVIGRCEDGELIDLDDETIALAEDYKFPLDPELIDMGSEEEPVEETEEEPVEETEEEPVEETEEKPVEETPTEEEPVEETPTPVKETPQSSTKEDSSALRHGVDTVIKSSLDKVFSELSQKSQDLTKSTNELVELREQFTELQSKYNTLEVKHKKLGNAFKALLPE